MVRLRQFQKYKEIHLELWGGSARCILASNVCDGMLVSRIFSWSISSYAFRLSGLLAGDDGKV